MTNVIVELLSYHYNITITKGDIKMNSKLLPVFLSISSLALFVMIFMSHRPFIAKFILGLIITICVVGILNIKK